MGMLTVPPFSASFTCLLKLAILGFVIRVEPCYIRTDGMVFLYFFLYFLNQGLLLLSRDDNVFAFKTYFSPYCDDLVTILVEVSDDWPSGTKRPVNIGGGLHGVVWLHRRQATSTSYDSNDRG